MPVAHIFRWFLWPRGLRLVRFYCMIGAKQTYETLTKRRWFLEPFRAPSQYPKRRLIVRSREVSKPRNLYLELSDRSEIWQALRQHCCRCACQISKRYDNLKYQSRGFETLRDLTKRRLFGYWDGALVLIQNGSMACHDVTMHCSLQSIFPGKYQFNMNYRIHVGWHGFLCHLNLWEEFCMPAVKYLLPAAPNPQTQMFLVSPCSCLCPIHWNQVLSREWSSADRRCPNYLWVINNSIAS